MTLLKDLENRNKYQNIGWIAPGWTLFEVFKNGQIFQQGNIDLVIAFIRASSLEETLLLANADADKLKTVEEVLKTSWVTLHLEDKLKTMERFEDPELNKLVFGSPEISEEQEKLFADVEDEDEEILDDEDEDDEEIEDEGEDDADED